MSGLAVYEGEWDHDKRTGRGSSRNAQGHVEQCTYENGERVGEGVRWHDPKQLKEWETKGPFRLKDGKVVAGISVAEAEGISKSLRLTVPTFPWHADEKKEED